MKGLFATVVAIFLSHAGFSQATGTIVSSGGSGQAPNTQLSWTVGEPFVGTFTTPNGSLTQGFYYLPLLVTSIGDDEDFPSLQVFPNPASRRLRIVARERQGYTLRLVDAAGRQRVVGTVEGGEEKELDVSGLPNGVYFLQLEQAATKLVKAFKIFISK